MAPSVFTKTGSVSSIRSFLVPFLILSILSTLLIPLAESTSLSLHDRAIDTPPASFQEQQQQDRVSYAPAVVDPSLPPIVDVHFDALASEQQQSQKGHLVKREPPATPTTASSRKSPKNKASQAKATMSTTTTATPFFTPDPKGDMALFGVPSVVGAYNLTSGILIYSAFMIAFVAAIGTATSRRAKYRDQFRLQQQQNMEGGRVAGGKAGGGGGSSIGDAELSDAALFKQASLSKRSLAKDAGSEMAANELLRSRIQAESAAAGGGDAGYGVRFGEGNGVSSGSTGRTGGMKKSSRGEDDQGFEMNAYGPGDPRFYQDGDNNDTSDYTSPPLAELDPYAGYGSSGSSRSGYLDQTEEGGPQAPKAAYQQPNVQRSGSSRMPKGDLERSGSGSSSNYQSAKIAVQNLLERKESEGGNVSRQGSTGSSRSRTHPTPIARSNSTRLPPSLRSGPQPPSGLGQSNYDSYE
ncbi:hypothetical protein B0O80DRAFT_145440 [Mortierella sp. GBAus27b]|nr:hypothetical protein BGX31_006803 [Mortierella sp. GBA43]KAI8349599.1 hypothetical protein B0O80DRAFT_145440 [Mortierella sp. GBAus27b]